MAKRFLTYNTEDAEAGKVPVNSQGIIDPEKIPCYDSRDIRTVTYTFDGNLEGKEVVEYNDSQWIRISDDAPAFRSILNIDTNAYVRDEETNELVMMSMSAGTASVSDFGDGVYGMPFTVLIITKDLDGCISTGVYAVNMDDYGYISRVSIEYAASGELKKLDGKFIPDAALIVTATENDDGTYTASHSDAEIYEAHANGKAVFFQFDRYTKILPLAYCDGEGVTEFEDVGFSGANVEGTRISIEGHTVVEHKWENGAIKFVQMGGGSQPSQFQNHETFETIHEYLGRGRQVVLKYGNNVEKYYQFCYKNTSVSPWILVFRWAMGNQYEEITINSNNEITVQSGTFGS